MILPGEASALWESRGPTKLANGSLSGMLPLFDPPREQAKATIASARQMGVDVKMVTGDQLAIARETSKQLGLGTNILDAAALGDTTKQESSQTKEAIEKADGFAQVFPEHKYHIVDVSATVRPYCRHDRRWRQRRAGAEEGRLRNRRFRRHGRGTGCRIHRAAHDRASR